MGRFGSVCKEEGQDPTVELGYDQESVPITED